MFNRTQILEEKFLKSLTNPSGFIGIDKNSCLQDEQAVEVFESQVASRLLDYKARDLRAENQAFYTIGSAGHEGNAAVAAALEYTDTAFLHYRSGAFFIQRSKQLGGQSPLYDLLLSFCAAMEDPISGGRHKVLGSKPLNIPPQTSTIASHLPKAIGHALGLARLKYLEDGEDNNHLSFCNFGDASFNHASSVVSFNSARWIAYQGIALPLVFLCEDNGIGISVPTPKDWVRRTAENFNGIKYYYCDGRDIFDVYQTMKDASAYAREKKRPCFVHMRTVRLLGHAGSDIEGVYRTNQEIAASEDQDPLKYSAQILIKRNILNQNDIKDIYYSLKERIDAIADEVKDRPRQTSLKEIKRPIEEKVFYRKITRIPDDEKRSQVWGKEWSQKSRPSPLGKLINYALIDLMAQYSKALVFGEDVAKKGGVYNITNGLLERFGPRRVFNSLLDETTILGTAIGLAHHDLLPVPEIQFLAYTHNAHDQIRGEAATLEFFSNNQFSNGMVIRIASFAYQKGFGGHFHNDNSIAMFMDIPGIIIATPSTGKDAVLMLRKCFELAWVHGKVVLFLEPIALYNVRDLHEKDDGLQLDVYPELTETIELGEISTEGNGRDLLIISYANGAYLSRQALKKLEAQGIHGSLLDLRWPNVVDNEAFYKVIKSFKKILFVDECRKKGSPTQNIISEMLEDIHPLPKIKRLCAADSFIPLGAAASALLPQTEDIIAKAKELMGDNK